MRLIDADKLIGEFLKYPIILRHSGDFVAVNLDSVIHEVRNAPTIEAEPVKHGRWDKNHDEDNIVYCDQCYMPQDMPTPYCHSCGAKMDGGDING